MTDLDPVRVVFFGDSICVGQGVSLYKGWVTRIAQELDEMAASKGREVIVVNSSINGRTTRQALEDMPYHVQASGVDLLIVQFGMNDCNYWQSDNGLPRVSPKVFAANLEEIIDRGITFGAKAVLLNNSHPTTRTRAVMPPTNLTYEQSNSRYNAIVRQVASSVSGQVLFNDVTAHFEEEIIKGVDLKTCLLKDELHLSEAGHQIYHRFMSPRVLSAAKALLDH